MTTPTFNSYDLDLPAAITSVGDTSATITRVGRVSAITESDNITVKISGSPTLVNASYLFPQYQPVLGDNVIVQKTDAQWLVLGTLSGPVDANTLALNPGFEAGTVGALPDNWTLTNTDVTAGVPTFRKELTYNPLSGLHVGQLDLVNNGVLDFSISQIVSAPVVAGPNQLWTGAGFIRVAALAGPCRIQATTFLRFFNAAGGVLGTALLNGGQEYAASGAGWTLLRPDSTLSASGVTPAGTASVSLVVEVLFNVQKANEEIIVEFDNMILRRVS
jgi:hypothetical protein